VVSVGSSVKNCSGRAVKWTSVRPDPQVVRERYDLPVFCVSSIDFQKLAGLRRGDGAAAVWRDAAGTEVGRCRLKRAESPRVDSALAS
jgi:hypothetical protein